MSKSNLQAGLDFITENWKVFAFILAILVLLFYVIPKIKRRAEINKSLSDSRKGKYNPLSDIAALEQEYGEGWFAVGNLEAYKSVNSRTDEELRLFVEKWSLRNPNLPLVTTFEGISYPYSWNVGAERDKFLTRLRSMGIGG